MNRGDRVIVRGRWPGTVAGPASDTVRVDVDGGSSFDYPVADVEPLASKAWPPGGLETKTPGSMQTK